MAGRKFARGRRSRLAVRRLAGHLLPMRRLPHARVAFASNHPPVTLAIQRVAHLHPAACGALGAERHGCVRFVLAEGHGSHIHLHRFEIEVRTLGQVVENTLTHSALALRSAFAAADERKANKQEREAADLHNSDYKLMPYGTGSVTR